MDATDNLLLESLAFGTQQTDVSLGSIVDGIAPIVKIFDPSPGASNLPAPGDTVRYDNVDVSVNTISLSAFTAPSLGGTLTLIASNGPPLDVAVFFLGFNPVQIPGIQGGVLMLLPELPDLWQVAAFNGTGSTSADYPIPNQPGLVGATIFTQATALSGGLSNGLAFTVGP